VVTVGWKTSYQAIFTALKTLLEADSNIERAFTGEQFRLTKLPMAIVNPGETTFTPGGLVGGTRQFQVELYFDVLCLVRETEPADWFAEVMTVTGAVVDVLNADRTLSGTVKDCYPVFHAPGEIRTADKLYYGGVVRGFARFFYSP
jgi:hypothetical protein